MKLPVCGFLLKMLQRLAKSEEQGKEGACDRVPSVLVTFYVVKPRGSLNTAACKMTGLWRRRRHRQGIGVERAGSAGGGDDGGGYNRREELLRYCRNLRMSVADQPPSAPPSPQRHVQGKRLLKKMITSLKKKKNVH